MHFLDMCSESASVAGTMVSRRGHTIWTWVDSLARLSSSHDTVGVAHPARY